MSSDIPHEWPWSDEQKRKYVWGTLMEQAQESADNMGVYIARTVQNEGDFEPIFLDKHEQRTILQDFDAMGKIRYLGHVEDVKNGYGFELIEPDRSNTVVFGNRILTFGDLVKDLELRNRVAQMIKTTFDVKDLREIRADRVVQTDIHESEEELLILMDKLNIIQTDWGSVAKQKHRVIGNRYVSVSFIGQSAKKLADAIYGRTSVIRVKALEQVASLIKEIMTQDGLCDFFLQNGISSNLIDGTLSKKDLAYSVLVTLSSTGDEADKSLLFHLLEEIAHPLTFRGETSRALDFQYKITNLLRFDKLSLLGGTMHEFSKSDEEEMSRIKTELEKVDPDFFNLIGDLFPSAASRKSTTSQNHNNTQEKTKDVEDRERAPVNIFHIHNNNQNNPIYAQPTFPSQNESGANEYDEKTSLKGAKIIFNDEAAQIIVNGKVCQLPPMKNGHYLCRAMFEHEAQVAVDWSVVYEKMTGYYKDIFGKPSDTREKWRPIYDAMGSVNDAVKSVFNTEDILFSWSEKTIRRNY